jgi:hypothetical protein
LGEQFLNAKMKGEVSYDRIAGYFCSSILEFAKNPPNFEFANAVGSNVEGNFVGDILPSRAPK